MKQFIVSAFFCSLILQAQCISFDCIFGYYSWDIVGNVYECNAKPGNILDGNVNLIDITGIHQSGKTNNDVIGLRVGDIECPFIPSGIDKFFPNLLVIHFYRANLTHISSDALRPFPKLKYFISFQNPLEIIDGDIFENNFELQQLDFGYNSLTNVGYNILDHLNRLKVAYFPENICIDFWATTPELIINLRAALALQCPPIATLPPTTTTSVTTISYPTSSTPPTCELVDDINLCSAEFEKMIDIQVALRTNHLVLNVFKLEEQLNETTEELQGKNLELQQELVIVNQKLSEKEERINELEQKLSETRTQVDEIMQHLGLL